MMDRIGDILMEPAGHALQVVQAGAGIQVQIVLQAGGKLSLAGAGLPDAEKQVHDVRHALDQLGIGGEILRPGGEVSEDHTVGMNHIQDMRAAEIRFGEGHIPAVHLAENQLLIRLAIGDHDQLILDPARLVGRVRIRFEQAPVDIQGGTGEQDGGELPQDLQLLLQLQQLLDGVIQIVLMADDRFRLAEGAQDVIAG